MTPSSSSGRAPTVRAWLAWWVVCAAEYLVLVDRADPQELVAGALLAALGATVAVVVRRHRLVRPAWRAAWLRAVPRVLAGLVTDLRPLAVALWRRGVLRRDESGRLTEVPYAAVGDDPEQTAHRVLTTTLGSTAPNAVVVDVDRERQVLLVHELVATADPARATRPLGKDVA